MVNYQQGKIYKIVCDVSGLTYIGSTCEPTLAKRLAVHVWDYKKWKRGTKPFISSFPILENGNYKIILLEEYPCENKMQLHARERFYIENNECINRVVPTRTWQEYREINKEQIREYMVQWRNDKKDHVQEYKKQYNQDYGKLRFACVCGSNVRLNDKSQHLKTKKHLNFISSDASSL